MIGPENKGIYKVPLRKQIKFLEKQIELEEKKREKYLFTPMYIHFNANTAHHGELWAIDFRRQNLIVRFKKGGAPRLGIKMAGFAYSIPSNQKDPNGWDFTFKTFREQYSRKRTDLQPIFYLKNEDPAMHYIGFKGIDIEFMTIAKQLLNQGKHPGLVIADTDPPIQYLVNLISFIKNHPNDPILNMDMRYGIDSWVPRTFKNLNSRSTEVIDALKKEDEVIVQGPPGTGKSHLIAEVLAKYLKEGHTVCITALTNKALMEVAGKEGLKEWISLKKVFKANMTHEEQMQFPKLQPTKDLTIPAGALLLGTYYKISEWYNMDNFNPIHFPTYDLIIIEEASQTFLATIAAFKKLAKKVIIIGDPIQLPPIVQDQNNASTFHPNMLRFIRGLEYYAPNCESTAYMLEESFRLGPTACELTGIFYNNRLISVASTPNCIKISEQYLKYLPKSNGTLFVSADIMGVDVKAPAIISFFVEMVLDINSQNPKISIAALSPYKDTIKGIQGELGPKIRDMSRITVDTIDRVQGLTVDFTFFFLPVNNPSFSFNKNRFNVGTSRARAGTLIISYKYFKYFRGLDREVMDYINNTPVVYYE